MSVSVSTIRTSGRSRGRVPPRIRLTHRPGTRGAWMLAVWLAAAAPALPADTASHHQAAVTVHRLVRSDDPAAVAAAITSMVLRLQPGLESRREDITAFARELVASAQFAEAVVSTYVELFDEAELRRMAELFADPVYQRYRQRRLQVVRRSTERVVELLRTRLPALQQRLRQARERDAGR